MFHKNLFILLFLSIADYLVMVSGNDIENLAREKGYVATEHLVNTPDGYYLGVYNIKKENDKYNDGNVPVVFLQHGLLDSGTTWLQNGKSESLACILLERGFDVWIGNNRGNKFSRKHMKYTEKDDEFWDFSFDEFAGIDVPVMISYVLETTKRENLSYVGHSQGTMQMFAMPTAIKHKKFLKFNDPRINNFNPEKSINLFIGLAPLIYLTHVSSPLVKLGAELPTVEFVTAFGKKEFLIGRSFTKFFSSRYCKLNFLACRLFFNGLFGDSRNINMFKWDDYVKYIPAGTSVKNMAHFVQLVRHSGYSMYNYGNDQLNLKYYDQKTPPQYHLNDIKFPVVLFAGTKDVLSNPTDYNLLLQEIPKEYLKASHVIQGYNHMDFCWAQNANKYVYEQLVGFLQQYKDIKHINKI